MKNNLIGASIVAVAIVVLGFCLKAGIDNYAYRDRSVSVRGLAEVDVPADHVTCPLVFKESGNDLLALYNVINTKSAAIVDFIVASGIDKADITLSAPEVVDMQTERYVSNEQQRARYICTAVVTISSDKVDTVRALLGRQSELLKKGIALSGDDYRYQTVYDFTKLNDLKPEMIENATKNARAAAEKFATDSNSKLGGIKHASQGLFTVESRDANTPFIKHVRVVTSVEYYLNN
jgi:uncharacterized protein